MLLDRCQLSVCWCGNGDVIDKYGIIQHLQAVAFRWDPQGDVCFLGEHIAVWRGINFYFRWCDRSQFVNVKVVTTKNNIQLFWITTSFQVGVHIIRTIEYTLKLKCRIKVGSFVFSLIEVPADIFITKRGWIIVPFRCPCHPFVVRTLENGQKESACGYMP